MSEHILLVSSSWASHERSGVSFSTEFHLKALISKGYNVSILGNDKSIQNYQKKVKSIYVVDSKGSGAIYSPSYVDHKKIDEIFLKNNIDLLIAEGWQRPINEAAIIAAKKNNIKTLMISHGISIFPFKLNLTYILRFVAWIPYLLFKFNRVLKSVDCTTTLSKESKSSRFYDRDRAISAGVQVKELLNIANHEANSFIEYHKRNNQCLIIGYFSNIKNQLELINQIDNFPKELTIKFVGELKGSYFKRCQKKVLKNNLTSRVLFCDSRTSNVSSEISQSKFLILPSITEALPITLIEAMSAGTPFISTNVGSVNSLKGGLIVDHVPDICDALQEINTDNDLWRKLSKAGLKEFKKKYEKKKISNNFLNLVDGILK